MYYKNSEKFLSVGLEHPGNFEQVIGIAKIQNESIAASSGNRRTWDKFHHIINPKTLESPKNILATWVIAKKAIIADGLATCLFFVPKEKLEKYFDFECLVLFPDYAFEKSNNFPAELFIEKKI
jgi:thiamine biosynthesis lipoprotein